ncbi:ATP-binding protein [Cytobacillus spongiae]|uniref:AlbA family DNA-binding domain-containing protein n=1 Tax=Cytobacillus spongiae TaxID=2901381 RepID=UPI001F28840A|nr:ATP-binding protein [Cytobacillus spongiae]UII55669.1 ATP-binding protein [Cytobacillus spongiae]
MRGNFEEKIYKLISKKTEGEYWDFKQEWHKDNERLLHDILCFANTVHDMDCYIIIGVSDDGEIIGLSDEHRVKQVAILDLLSNTVFAGDNTPEVSVETIRIDCKDIDILTIYNTYNVPFYLKKKGKRYSNIKEGCIYTRIGDKNTSISQNANMQQIEMLWKKRLGLTQPPLKQIVNRLKNKSEWVENNETHYNIYKPEFKLVEEYEDDEYDRRSEEFYVYSQTNSKFMYKNLKIMCNETVLEDFQLVILDSGRFKTPIPQWGYVGRDQWGINHKYSYKYYLKDSIDYELQQFFFDDEDMEEVYAKRNLDEVVLYFENEAEKLSFESYVECKLTIIDSNITESEKVHFTVDTGNKREAKVNKHRLSVGLALNKAFQDYKESFK